MLLGSLFLPAKLSARHRCVSGLGILGTGASNGSASRTSRSGIAALSLESGSLSGLGCLAVIDNREGGRVGIVVVVEKRGSSTGTICVIGITVVSVSKTLIVVGSFVGSAQSESLPSLSLLE